MLAFNLFNIKIESGRRDKLLMYHQIELVLAKYWNGPTGTVNESGEKMWFFDWERDIGVFSKTESLYN